MQSDSGYNLPPLKPVPEVMLTEAVAQVDAWGAEHEGTDFRSYKIARVLRAEVARLEAEIQTLTELLFAEMNGNF